MARFLRHNLKHNIVVLQNMNDEPLLETLIYSTTNIPFTHLNCSDKDSPQGQLRYSIVGGKT